MEVFNKLTAVEATEITKIACGSFIHANLPEHLVAVQHDRDAQKHAHELEAKALAHELERVKDANKLLVTLRTEFFDADRKTMADLLSEEEACLRGTLALLSSFLMEALAELIRSYFAPPKGGLLVWDDPFPGATKSSFEEVVALAGGLNGPDSNDPVDLFPEIAKHTSKDGGYLIWVGRTKCFYANNGWNKMNPFKCSFGGKISCVATFVEGGVPLPNPRVGLLRNLTQAEETVCKKEAAIVSTRVEVEKLRKKAAKLLDDANNLENAALAIASAAQHSFVEAVHVVSEDKLVRETLLGGAAAKKVTSAQQKKVERLAQSLRKAEHRVEEAQALQAKAV